MNCQQDRPQRQPGADAPGPGLDNRGAKGGIGNLGLHFPERPSPENAAAFETALQGQVYAHIGDVSDDGHLCIQGEGGSDLIRLPVQDLARAFAGAAAQRVAPENS